MRMNRRFSFLYGGSQWFLSFFFLFFFFIGGVFVLVLALVSLCFLSVGFFSSPLLMDSALFDGGARRFEMRSLPKKCDEGLHSFGSSALLCKKKRNRQTNIILFFSMSSSVLVNYDHDNKIFSDFFLFYL